MKTVCSECGGDIREVQSFKAKISSWHEVLTGWITLYQCKKCKMIFTREN